MPDNKQLIGINLGGWLVLEKWMTPSVFKGSRASDEFTYCKNAKDNKTLSAHRSKFITKKDIEKIANEGFNSIRLPVGHWIFGDFEPYVKTDRQVDKLFEWAKQYKMQVIIDLHTAPGSQNGLFNSGKEGETEWHLNHQNIEQTIEVIRKIAQKYGRHPNLYGIELLNEPSRDIPLYVLQDYYDRAYKETIKHTKAKVIMSDAYRPLAEWQDFINQHKNALLDVHLYQAFEDKPLSLEEHIAKCFKWKRDLDAFGADKIIIGEWSASLKDVYNKMPHSESEQAKRLYTAAQLYAFTGTAGRFYWSYKTEQDDTWNYSALAL